MHQHLHYRGLRRRKTENELKKIFEEIIAENFSNMGKETVAQVQEVERDPYRINPRRSML